MAQYLLENFSCVIWNKGTNFPVEVMAILLVKTKILKRIIVCSYINLILVLLKSQIMLLQTENFT